MKKFTKKEKKLQRVALSLLILYLLWNVVDGSHNYPPYQDLEVISGKLVKVVDLRKGRDILYIERESGVEEVFYEFTRGLNGKNAKSLIGLDITGKYFNKGGCENCDRYLVEVYIDEKMIYGDYKAMLETADSNEARFIFYPFLFILCLFFVLTFFTPEKD